MSQSTADSVFMQIAGPLLRNHYEKDWGASAAGTHVQPDRLGLACILSLPAKGDLFVSPFLTSNRLQQGLPPEGSGLAETR